MKVFFSLNLSLEETDINEGRQYRFSLSAFCCCGTYAPKCVAEIKSDINSGSGPEKVQRTPSSFGKQDLGWGSSVPLCFNRKKNPLYFIPHMGLIAVFKIFQLLCHVRLC